MIAGKTPEWTTTEVWLDGKKVDKCFEADDSTGTVWIDDPGSFEGYVILRGKVEFKKITPQTKIQASDIGFYGNGMFSYCNGVNWTQEIEADWIDEGYELPTTELTFTGKAVEITGAMVNDTTYEFSAPVSMLSGDTLEISIEVAGDGITINSVSVIRK
jgi:hypothetical protein